MWAPGYVPPLPRITDHQVVNFSSSAPLVRIEDEDDAAIYFSSGTTGFPKAILHNHRKSDAGRPDGAEASRAPPADDVLPANSAPVPYRRKNALVRQSDFRLQGGAFEGHHPRGHSLAPFLRSTAPLSGCWCPGPRIFWMRWIGATFISRTTKLRPVAANAHWRAAGAARY